MPQLNARPQERIGSALREGARYHGFSADLWTLPRVATVIERVTGVRYPPRTRLEGSGSDELDLPET
jgi:hypothetical protein